MATLKLSCKRRPKRQVQRLEGEKKVCQHQSSDRMKNKLAKTETLLILTSTLARSYNWRNKTGEAVGMSHHLHISSSHYVQEEGPDQAKFSE